MLGDVIVEEVEFLVERQIFTSYQKLSFIFIMNINDFIVCIYLIKLYHLLHIKLFFIPPLFSIHGRHWSTCDTSVEVCIIERKK